MKCPPNIDRSRLKAQPLRRAVNMTMDRRPRLTRARSDQRRSAYTMTELLPKTGLQSGNVCGREVKTAESEKGTKTDRRCQKAAGAMGPERSGRAGVPAA